MLNECSIKINENLYYLSSYKSLPEFMYPRHTLPPKSVKLGELYHEFMEMIFQFEVKVSTSIYINFSEHPQVYSFYIKTHKEEIKWILPDYQESYDYVLAVFHKGNENIDIKNNPVLLKKMLLILFFEMAQYDTPEFTPSKTYLGKKISAELGESMRDLIPTLTTFDDLLAALEKVT